MMDKSKFTFGNISLGARARELLTQSIEAGWISAGPHVKAFEKAYAETFGTQEAVAVSSGTTAGFVSIATLHDFGGTWGDEVIVPALCFVAAANCVTAAGFKPVFVDIDRRTLNIDPAKIEAAITPRTRAINVVHTMGKPVDMDPILEIAKKHNLMVFEDACEAHGAQYKGRYVGTMGDAGAFSFYAAHIICSGEGGMVTTNRPEVAQILRSVRSHGRPDGTLFFQFDRFGFNCKMNDLEAAVGLEGIENFWSIFNKRKANLNYLLKHTADLSNLFYFTSEGPDEVVSAHAFQMTLKEEVPLDFWDFYRHLESQGIQTKLNFGSLPTQHKVFSHLGYKLGDFPEAEYVGQKGLHVGCHQYLEQEHLDYLIEVVHQYVRQRL
ncbi:MAG: DegT/DnrJ/EryC1/StrS family aminotransferase [Myxococcota bacterium]